jgi:hypothetical protein
LFRFGSGDLGRRVLAVAAVISVASGAAFADVHMSVEERISVQAFQMLPPLQRPDAPASETSHRPDSPQASKPHVEFTDILATAAFDRSAAACYPLSPEEHIPPTQTAQQLPAGPGAVSLCLMGIGCIGAVKLGRSARSLHLQSMPEWFHTGGPIHIGHVSVLDLDARVLLAPYYDQPPSKGSESFSHPPQPLLPIAAQCFLTAVDSRGPPELHI